MAQKQSSSLAGDDGLNNNNAKLISSAYESQGVSIEYLINIDVPADWNFAQVCGKIKSLTRSKRGNRSLAAFLKENPETSHFVEKADYFVSYAWNGGFGKTMKALRSHFDDKNLGNPFLWMDFAIVDQHVAATTDIDFTEWAETFGRTFRDIGKAILVLTPGEKPIAIGRSWCCFEWVCITRANIPFEYCVDPDDAERLIRKMKSGKLLYQDFHGLFAGINVEKAKATKKNDEQAILQMMSEIGITQVNDIVMLSLKDWLLQVATEGERRAKMGTIQGTLLLNTKAELYDALGDFHAALPLYQQALESARQIPITDDSRTDLLSGQLNNLASIMTDHGDFVEAERLYRESLAMKATILDLDETSLATTMNNLGDLLQSKGNLVEAERLYRESLALRERQYGRNSLPVAQSLNNLADLLQDNDKLDDAEILLRESLAIRERKLGKDHPTVSQSLNNLGDLLFDKGDEEQAERLYLEALTIREKTLGTHPSVAHTLANLAHLYTTQTKYSLAEPLFRKSLAIREKVFGRDNLEVAKAMGDLAGMLLDKEYKGIGTNVEEAEQLYRSSLAIREKLEGPDHFHVGKILAELAELVAFDKNQLEEGAAMYRRALAIIERVEDGKDNLREARLKDDLAKVLERKNPAQRTEDEEKEIEELYRIALRMRRNLLPEDHRKVLKSMKHLAAFLERDAATLSEAQSIRLEILAIESRTDHPGE